MTLPWWWPRRFRKNPYLISDALRIQDAFILQGVKYYQCATATDLPAGRAFASLFLYEEYRMKCDKEYLDKHISATEKLLAGKEGVVTMDHLLAIKNINFNLKERVNITGMSEHLYRLASVYFWDDYESPYYYDIEYNRKKILKWKKSGEAMSFFLTQPLKDLMPFLESDDMNAQTYLKIADQIDQMHQQKLQEILSKPA